MSKIVPTIKPLSSLLDEAAVCMQKNQIYKAVGLYSRAIRIAPKIPQLHNNLGSLLRELGMVDDSIKCFKQALRLKSNYASAHSNLLFVLQNLPNQTLKILLNEHKHWANLHLASIKLQKQNCRSYSNGSVIVIGIVSPDFYFHPVSVFILPWLEKRNRINFKIIAYSDRIQEDAMSIRLKQNVDEWKNVVDKTDDQFAFEIEQDQVDVLIDLAGHTAGNRLKMFARRAAPLQITWLGYSATTGVPAMDVVLMDEYISPQGYEKYFTEKLVRLEGLRFCYTPPIYAPDVAPPPFLINNYLTFGCFNNLAKLTPHVIQTWASILNHVPESRLILKWKSLGDQEVSRRIKLNFERFGVPPNRVECRGWSKHAAMLFEYSDVDIALDPFPFSGGLTSCDALYMGVPVITMPSDLPISRQTGSFLKAIGLNELIANDLTDYQNIVVNISGNISKLKSLRQTLRAKLLQSMLCDSQAFAKSVEKAIHENLLQVSKLKV